MYMYMYSNAIISEISFSSSPEKKVASNLATTANIGLDQDVSGFASIEI